MNRLKQKYIENIVPAVKKEFKLPNVMVVPRLQKISINAGIGSFRENREAVDTFVGELAAMAGQKPYPRTARLSEAGFKVRKGDVVGYAVTLRGDRMWAFLDKFINIALPRVRDFRGLKDTAFDEVGNYSVGVKEHVIFPEVNANVTKGIRSMQLTIVTNSKNKDLNRFVLKELGMPFRKDTKN